MVFTPRRRAYHPAHRDDRQTRASAHNSTLFLQRHPWLCRFSLTQNFMGSLFTSFILSPQPSSLPLKFYMFFLIFCWGFFRLVFVRTFSFLFPLHQQRTPLSGVLCLIMPLFLRPQKNNLALRLFDFSSSCDNLGYRAVMSFWVVCLVMVSSISDSQPHYSVGLLYHRAGLAVQSFPLLYRR